MSYDLMVFDHSKAPNTYEEFMVWYFEQTKWSEPHDYMSSSVTSPLLRSWFMEMKDTFPPMNGEYSPTDDQLDEDESLEPRLTDYCIGTCVIYMAFAWSQIEPAYNLVTQLASKHGLGFFDVSGDESVTLPDGTKLTKPEPPKKAGLFKR